MTFSGEKFFSVGKHLGKYSKDEEYQRSAVGRFYYACYLVAREIYNKENNREMGSSISHYKLKEYFKGLEGTKEIGEKLEILRNNRKMPIINFISMKRKLRIVKINLKKYWIFLIRSFDVIIMQSLKTVSKQQDLSNVKFNQELSKEFILINPKEINEFISNKSGLIELINESYKLINGFFPNSKIYLQYNQDPEYDDLKSIFASIIMIDDDFDSNNKVYNDLLTEFVKLKELYDDVYFCYYVNVSYNEEYLKFKRKRNYNHYQ